MAWEILNIVGGPEVVKFLSDWKKHTPSDIEKGANVKPRQVFRVINKLEEKELVDRERDENNVYYTLKKTEYTELMSKSLLQSIQDIKDLLDGEGIREEGN